MENLVLEVKNENWGEIGPGIWESTIWRIYGDLKMDVLISYDLESKKKVKHTKISQKDYDYILDLLKQSERVLVDVDALDGSAWEIKRYQGKSLVWQRDMGYIYGIRPLEILAHHLYKISDIKRERK